MIVFASDESSYDNGIYHRIKIIFYDEHYTHNNVMNELEQNLTGGQLFFQKSLYKSKVHFLVPRNKRICLFNLDNHVSWVFWAAFHIQAPIKIYTSIETSHGFDILAD